MVAATVTMVFMLPRSNDKGARLAEVLPSALASLQGVSDHPARTVVVIVIDGLGWVNLEHRRGHARTLAGLRGGPISTVTPSTTGAALTTLTTGCLPGEHGLVGYRIMHPQLGLITTLSEWQGIAQVRDWQLRETVFEQATRDSIRCYTIGRSAHRVGGLTSAILSGATYVPADTIADRFEAATNLVRGKERSLVYLYIDELDRAGHGDGWLSDSWIHRLEQLDAALNELLASLPKDVGVMLTADHGMIDIPPSQHQLFRDAPNLLEGVRAVGGEPRFRYLYLDDPATAAEAVGRIGEAEGERAWVFTRDDAIAQGMFGDVAPGVADRMGEVIVAAREEVAYYRGVAGEEGRGMLGQHGSLTDIERLVPLLYAGAFA